MYYVSYCEYCHHFTIILHYIKYNAHSYENRLTMHYIVNTKI